MNNINVKYMKDEDGNIISPLSSDKSIYCDFTHSETETKQDMLNNILSDIYEQIEVCKNSRSEQIGSVKIWFSDDIPYGWLLLNGQAVSRADYHKLFDLWGTTFGSGNGSTTFNLPDMRDYVPVGKSSTDTNINTVGKKYGEKTHTLTTNEIPSHSHNLSQIVSMGNTVDGSNWYMNYPANGTASASYLQVKASGGGQAHNNMQPSLAVNFIVKAVETVPLNPNLEIGSKQPSAITISTSTAEQIYVDTAYKTHLLHFDTIESQCGGKFTVSDNGVKIGAGVKRIIISSAAHLHIDSDYTIISYRIRKLKQGSSTFITDVKKNLNDWVDTFSVSSFICDVQENDIIQAYVQIETQGRTIAIYETSYLTVQEVPELLYPIDKSLVQNTLDIPSDVNTASVNAINEGLKDIHSTQETLTNKVWFDGKPIYRKVVPYTSGANNTSNIIVNISGMKYVTEMYGYMTEGSYCHKLPLTYQDVKIFFQVRLDTGNITEYHDNLWASNRSCVMVFEYTKKVDYE